MTPLDQQLGTVLRAHWKGGNRPAAHQTLRTALAADPTLKAEAETRREQLEALDRKCNGHIEKRCVVSAVHLEALRSALT
jgi:hypothetical protein